MSLMTRYFEQRQVFDPLHPRDPALADLFATARPTASGMTVTERTAITWTALASGVRLASETIGMLPVDVVRLDGKKRIRKSDHPVAQVLMWPNPEMSAMEFREVMQTQLEFWGTGYAQIIWDGAQRPKELWPLPADRVTPERDSRGNLVFRVALPEEPFGIASESSILPADQVLVIRGWTRYGLLGERMSRIFQQAIGLGLATEYFGASLFGNGAHAGGVLEHPGTLTDDAQKRLIKQKENQVGGISRAHRTMVLEEGMKWHQTTIEPEKAQFLGTRTFQLLEGCRILRLPPHVLYELSRATFSNIEHQSIELVTYSWLPRARRWESRLAMQLLGPKDFQNTQIKFNMGALLRGDTAARMALYQSGIQMGWLSQNDVRELEDMSPIQGGDTYRAPANIIPVDQPPPTPNPQPTPTGADDDDDDQTDD